MQPATDAHPPTPGVKASPPVLARPVGGTAPPPYLPAYGWTPPPRPPSPLLLPDLTPRQALADALLVFLATIFVHYVPSLLAWSGKVETPGAGFETVLLASKWVEALLAVGFLAYFVRRNGVRAEAFGLRTDRGWMQTLWSAGALIGVYGFLFAIVTAVGLYYVATNHFPVGEDQIAKRVEFAERLPLDNLGLSILLLSAVAIHEEVLFRGLLLPLLRRVTGHWWIAVLATSAIFGSLHFPQGWTAVVMITGVSVVLSLAFILSRSLPAVIVTHFLFDLIQFQLVRFVSMPEVEKLLRDMPR